MYLSRFEFNTARRGARDLLSSPQKLHAAVLAGFPAGQAVAGDTGRVLWRLDQEQRQTLLYLVSPDRPDLTHLVENAGWPTTQTWDTRDYGLLLKSLAAGDRFAFRLTANPVRSLAPSAAGERGKRVGHVTVTQQTNWLLSQAARHGFAVPVGEHGEPDIAVHSRRVLKFPRQGRTVTLSTAVFQGRLDVTDPDLLRASLSHGIGPGKGYGCGLLTLAPAR